MGRFAEFSPSTFLPPSVVGSFVDVMPSPFPDVVSFPRPAVPSVGTGLDVVKGGSMVPVTDSLPKTISVGHQPVSAPTQEVVSFGTPPTAPSEPKPSVVSFPNAPTREIIPEKKGGSFAPWMVEGIWTSVKKRPANQDTDEMQQKATPVPEMATDTGSDVAGPAATPEPVGKDVDVLTHPEKFNTPEPAPAIAPAPRPPIEIVDGRWIINQAEFFSS